MAIPEGPKCQPSQGPGNPTGTHSLGTWQPRDPLSLSEVSRQVPHRGPSPPGGAWGTPSGAPKRAGPLQPYVLALCSRPRN